VGHAKYFFIKMQKPLRGEVDLSRHSTPSTGYPKDIVLNNKLFRPKSGTQQKMFVCLF